MLLLQHRARRVLHLQSYLLGILVLSAPLLDLEWLFIAVIGLRLDARGALGVVEGHQSSVIWVLRLEHCHRWRDKGTV